MKNLSKTCFLVVLSLSLSLPIILKQCKKLTEMPTIKSLQLTNWRPKCIMQINDELIQIALLKSPTLQEF